MSMMNYHYITKPSPFASAQSTSKRLESLLRKRERWGPSGNLDRDIKNAEDVLDMYLIKAGNEALKSLNKIQSDLEELIYRVAAGYLTSEQIDQTVAIKSQLRMVLSNR